MTDPEMSAFFHDDPAHADPVLEALLRRELTRQQDSVELIASENIVSRAVMRVMGSVLTNKYAEGYPGRRYYGGCEVIDEVETLAIERAKQLFRAGFANVQPHSGAQANQTVFLALLRPGDPFMGMTLASGGHLSHGAAPNLSGKWFQAIGYDVRRDDGLIDYDQVAALAERHRPKLIIAGGSAYPRIIDFQRFRKIADRAGALLMVDMAHFAGLVAGGAHPNPLDHAHVVTSTTHKTLRGARGGLILTNDEALAKKINSALFPGLQGGPLQHCIAGKAVAFEEALRPKFREYAHQVVKNAQALAATLIAGGLGVVSGGTDTHLLLVDLRPMRLTGVVAEQGLERVGLTCNKNAIPFDPEKPAVTSGIRLGTPAATTRGFREREFQQVGEMILKTLRGLATGESAAIEREVRAESLALCRRFPLYDAAY